MLGDGEELFFQEGADSWTLKKRGSDGAEREIYLEWLDDEQALMCTVYVDTEHSLIVLDRPQAKALLRWLDLQLYEPPTRTESTR